MNWLSDAIVKFDGEYRFLSNFVGRVVTPRGTVCETVEHGFQAAKTLDPVEQELVLNCSTPGRAKRQGRKVTLRGDWDEVKLNVMAKLVRWKFQQNPVLGGRLLATGNALLIEGNTWHDNFWGSCTCSRCKNRGKNHLGQILMAVRAQLREAK